MAIYIPKANIVDIIKKRIQLIPLLIENIKIFREIKKKKLKYENIILIEYTCLELPELVCEECILNIENISLQEYQSIIELLKKEKALKWKRNYYAKFMFYDGLSWSLTLTFKDGYKFISTGDIIFPKNFSKIYSQLEKYIVCTEEFD